MARINGGGIYGAAFNEINIMSGSVLKNNRAVQGQGDDVYVANTQNTLQLDSVEISNKYAQTSIYVDTASLVLASGLIHDIKSRSSLQGGAVQCYNCKSVLIDNMRFTDLYSQRGGAVYFFENTNNKKESDGPGKY